MECKIHSIASAQHAQGAALSDRFQTSEQLSIVVSARAHRLAASIPRNHSRIPPTLGCTEASAALLQHGDDTTVLHMTCIGGGLSRTHRITVGLLSPSKHPLSLITMGLLSLRQRRRSRPSHGTSRALRWRTGWVGCASPIGTAGCGCRGQVCSLAEGLLRHDPLTTGPAAEGPAVACLGARRRDVAGCMR